MTVVSEVTVGTVMTLQKLVRVVKVVTIFTVVILRYLEMVGEIITEQLVVTVPAVIIETTVV